MLNLSLKPSSKRSFCFNYNKTKTPAKYIDIYSIIYRCAVLGCLNEAANFVTLHSFTNYSSLPLRADYFIYDKIAHLFFNKTKRMSLTCF